jgi:hypothetical protein
VKLSLEAAPGELEDRLDEVIKTITEMAGGDLCKAEPDPAAHEETSPYPAIQTAVVKVTQRQVLRIQRIMQRRLSEVILRKE